MIAGPARPAANSAIRTGGRAIRSCGSQSQRWSAGRTKSERERVRGDDEQADDAERDSATTCPASSSSRSRAAGGRAAAASAASRKRGRQKADQRATGQSPAAAVAGFGGAAGRPARRRADENT